MGPCNREAKIIGYLESIIRYANLIKARGAVTVVGLASYWLLRDI